MRRIERKADFHEDVVDDEIIRCAIGTLVGDAGMEMRNEKLGLSTLRLGIRYSDGFELYGFKKTKRLLVMDGEIMAVAEKVYRKAAARRIRVSSISISLEDFAPLGFQPDLFEAETDAKNQKLQEALDKINRRHGAGMIMRGAVLALLPAAKQTL